MNTELNMKTIKPVLKKLALGQIIALCIAVTGIVNEQITSKTRNNVNAPALTTVSVYLLLFPLCTLPFAYQSIKNNSSSSISCTKSIKSNLKITGLYFLLALMDVEANWFIIKAYQYTSILYAQVLDASIIPIAMVLSVIFLRVRFKFMHYIGSGLCILGTTLLCFSAVLLPCDNDEESEIDKMLVSRQTHVVNTDFVNNTGLMAFSTAFSTPTPTPTTDENSSDENKQLLGNFYVILASFFYAGSNVLQEYLVKTRKSGISEARASFGLFGPIIIVIQLLITGAIWAEIESFQQTEYFLETVGLILIFSFAMVIIYFVMPLALSETSAIFVNLSMLTADIYAVLVGYFIFGNCISVLYLIGFIVIDSGIVAYNLKQVESTDSDEDVMEESLHLSQSEIKT